MAVPQASAFELADIPVIGDLATALGISAQADGTQGRAAVSGAGVQHDADTSTTKEYTLGDEDSTQYDGRVWVDKSVSAGNSISFGGNTVTNDSDFLVTYSALATSTVTVGQTPTDTVFILDFSTSMTWGYSQDHVSVAQDQSRIQAMITSVNNAIDALVKANTQNRIAIAVFNGSSTTLLPNLMTGEAILQRVSDGNYLSIYGYTYTPGQDGGRADVRCNINGETTSTGGGTNIQAGMFAGMEILADNTDTTAEVNGETVTRIPNVILMSDGAPTTFSSATDATYTRENGGQRQGSITNDTALDPDQTVQSGSWWSTNSGEAIGSGDNDNPDSADGFMALLTASYYKNAITDRYYGNSGDEANIYTISFGTDVQTDAMVAMANLVLNPEGNWDSSATQNTGQVQAVVDAWNRYSSETQNNEPVVRAPIGDGNNDTKVNFRVSHPTGSSAAYDPDSLFYPTQYFAAADDEQLEQIFEEIASMITSSASVPTEVTGNPIDSGYIKYKDTTGQYMEIKNVKTLIFMDQVLSVTKDENNSTDVREVYVAGSYEYSNPAYPGQSFNTDQIEIVVTDNGDNTQTIEVNVPAALIPLRTNTVTLDGNGDPTNNDASTTLPLRLCYEVGLAEGIDAATLNGVDEEYLKNNSENGKVSFYSNAYTEGEQTNNGVGATVEFEPAPTNPFYFVQEDTPLYVADEGSPTGYSRAIGQFDSGATYYVPMTYYDGEGSDVKKVTSYVARSGETLAGFVGSDNSGLYIREGSPRIGNLQDVTASKPANETGTYGKYREPTFVFDQGDTNPQAGHFLVLLGNNGVLSVPYMSKDVTSGADSDVSIDGDLVGVGDTLHYVVTWVNTATDANGDAVAATVKVSDVAPAGTSYIADSAVAYRDENGTKVDMNVVPTVTEVDDRANLTWEFRAPAGASGTVEFDMKVDASAVDNAENLLPNTATITVGENEFTTNTTYNYVPEKDVFATDGEGAAVGDSIDGQSVKVGDVLTYTISYRNTEDAPATITVRDVIPTGTEYVDDSTTHNGVAVDDTDIYTPEMGSDPARLEWTFENVASGATGTVSFQVRVTEDAVSSVTNDATVKVGDHDPVITKEVENPVASGSLAITKTVENVSTTEDFTFTVQLSNNNGPLTGRYDYTVNGGQTQQIVLDEHGQGTILLSHDETATITGLPAGASYTVSETSANGYVTVVPDNASGSITADTTVEVAFVNRATATLTGATELPVSKAFSGWTEADAGQYPQAANASFTFTLAAVDGTVDGNQIGANDVPMPTNDQVTISKPASGTEAASAFGDIVYSQPGTYNYTIAEQNDGLYGIEYSDAVYDVVVTVETQNGSLVATAEIVLRGETTPTEVAAFINGWNPGTQTKDVEIGDGDTTGDNGDTVQVGDVLTYTINWVNNATDADGKPVAANVTVTDTVPKGTEFVSADNDIQPDTNGDLSWNLGNQTAGASGAVSFQVRVTEDAITTDSITNRATIELGNHDPAVEYNTNEVENPVQKGSLSIAKTVTGVGADTSKEFEFTVTASVAGENLEGTYTVDDVDGVNSVDFNGGKATISLKHGETAIITGLPEGTAYTVTEADYTTDGYTTTKTGDEGTIVANPTAEAAFTNTFDPVDETVDPGSIAGRVNKVLAGGREPGLQEGEFTFEAVVTPTDGSTFDGVTMPAGAEQITEGGAVTGYRLTATNGAAGVDGSAPVAFGDITFEQAGTFHVKVREVVPTGDGADSTINYDDHVFTYDIEVAFDAAAGKLVAKVTNTSTADGGATFTNTYNPGDGPQKSVSDEEGADINNQPVAVGDELTYTISYRNTENRPATIVITDAVPEGTVFVSAENNPTTAPQPDGTGDIAWTIEDVPAGESGDVSFTVRVTEAALQYDKITNTATVQVGNNPSTETNQVENPIEVPEPVKSVSGENGVTDGSNVSVGDVLTYTISWTANADYNQVTIRDAAPEHTALVDGSVSAPGAIEGDDIVWRFSNVESGQTITVSFKVEVLKDASDTTVQNQGTLTIGENEYTIDTNTVTNPVDPAPTSAMTHISAAKILSGRDWIDNDAFTFELSGVNTDSNDATGFEITTDNPVTVTKEDTDAAASDSSSTEGIEVPFGWDVAFTQAGTYQFTVHETSTTPGVTNAAEQTFTVVVSDIKGIEVISEPVSLLFTNTYSPAAGTAGLEAVKTVNGSSKGLEAGAFQFKIEPADGAPMPAGPQGGVVSNDVDGRIDFGTFSFSAPGTYAYTVSEVPGTAAGYTYDDTVYTVTFTVDDADVTNGTLEVTRAITVDGVPAESVIFSNTYQPQEVTTPAEAPFSGTKSVTNEHGAFELQAGQFSFVMENTSKPAGVETAPVPSEGSTVQNEADGSYSFGTLTFEQPGTYTYKVYEQQGGLAGITYDGTEYVLSFTVEDQDGQLIITSQTVTTANGQASATGMDFANIYNDGQVSVNLGGTKVLETNGFAGASLSEGAYTFVLLDQSGARVARAFNGAPSGNTASFAFDPITYTADDLGTHTYTVVELGADGQPGTGGTDDQRVAHSTQAYTVTVTVSADEQAQGDGALKADVAIANVDGDASSMEFTNSYEPTPGTVGPNGSAQIAGTKELAGRALNAGEFTFELLQGDEVIDQVTNNADGSFAFGKDLTFEAEGTYVYAVREAAGTLGGVTYDDTLYAVVITVVEDADAHALVPTVAYQLDGEDATGMTFSNTYEAAPAYAQLGVAKMLENADLVDGQFSFELAAATAGAPMPKQTKATNAANGAVSFGQVVYTEPGEYDYTVTEINDGQEGIAYDEDTTRTIHVSVTDNGQGSLVATVSYGDEGPVFVNTANPDEPTEPQEPGQPEQPAEPSKPEAPSENLPVTGDYLPMVASGAVLVAIALVAGGVVIRRKQR